MRFYANGAIDYVTVNDQLPLATYDPSYNGGYAFDAPQNGILWAALAEKAFAEENLTGQVDTSQPGVASYAALNSGDASVALAAITGSLSGYSDVTPGATASDIAADLKDGNLVCINTPNSSDIESHLVPDHCYAVVGYNPSSSMPFELFNPWGINTYSETGGKTYGSFVAGGGYLEANFTTYAFAASAAPGPAPQGAVLPAASPGSGTIPSTDEVAVSLAADSSQRDRFGTEAAIHTSTIDASPGQTIVIGLAPTNPSASVGDRRNHLELVLGSLLDEDFESLTS